MYIEYEYTDKNTNQRVKKQWPEPVLNRDFNIMTIGYALTCIADELEENADPYKDIIIHTLPLTNEDVPVVFKEN